jgi:hypothetical protein
MDLWRFPEHTQDVPPVCYNSIMSESVPIRFHEAPPGGKIGSKPIGLRNEKGEKSPPLMFKDFVEEQNNFYCLFIKDGGKELNLGRIYRQEEYFQKCLADHPAKVKKYLDELGSYEFQRWDVDNKTNKMVILPDDPRGPEMERKVYDAYLPIREYVDDDCDLFT